MALSRLGLLKHRMGVLVLEFGDRLLCGGQEAGEMGFVQKCPALEFS